MQSAVDHVLTGAGPHPRPGPGARRGGLGAVGRLRPGQPGPDLRHAGGVAGRLGDVARRGAGLRARPRLGVLADRRGRHRPGPSGPPRRAADARRGRPGRQVRRSPTSGSRRPGSSWYEVSNWARDDARRAAGTTSSTGPARTGGASARAPTRTWGACGGGTSGTPRRTPTGSRAGSARRTGASCSTPRPGGSSGCCWSCGSATGCRWTCSTTTGRAAVPGQVERGLVTVEANRLVLTAQGRLLADAVVRDLLP